MGRSPWCTALHRWMRGASALILLLATAASAQDWEPERADPFAQPWRIQSYHELSKCGLSQIVEGSGGKIWFATDIGVACYNGYDWKTWTVADGLLDQKVKCVHELRDGTVVAGSARGVSVLVDGAWKCILGRPGGLTWLVTSLFEARDGSLWVATRWGAARRKEGRWTLFCQRDVASVLPDVGVELEIRSVPEEILSTSRWGKGVGLKIGTIDDHWFIFAILDGGPAHQTGLALGDQLFSMRHLGKGGSGVDANVLTLEEGGRCRISYIGHDGEPVEIMVPSRSLEGEYRTFWISQIAEAPSGELWFCDNKGGVFCYQELDGNSPNWSRAWETEDAKRLTRVTSRKGGTSWLTSTYWKYLIRDHEGSPQRLEGPDGKSVLVSAEDGVGVFWAVSKGRLFSLRGEVWREHQTPPLPGGPSMLLATSAGMLWLGDSDGNLLRVDIDDSRLRSFQGIRFACQTEDGARWFRCEDGGIAVLQEGRWIRHDPEGDLGFHADDLIVTRDGCVTAYGSEADRAIVGRWAGTEWELDSLPYLELPGTRRGRLMEASDGSLWFGGGYGEDGEAEILRRPFGGEWQKTGLPSRGKSSNSIVETAPGSTWWCTDGGLYHYQDGTMTVHGLPPGLRARNVVALCGDSEGHLWIGSASRGVFQREGNGWTPLLSGLRFGDLVLDLVRDKDGILWASTGAGLCRLDSGTWRRVVSWPNATDMTLRVSSDGSLWLHDGTTATRYLPDSVAPDTTITARFKSVPAPGRTTLLWSGKDRWNPPTESELTFSHRLDSGEWSPFSEETTTTFDSLPVGEHEFQVRARDRDFNVDPFPDALRFTVTQVIWREAWFLCLIAAFSVAIGGLGYRVIRRGQRLRESVARTEAAEAARARIERESAERRRAEQELNRYQEHLEELIADRTRQLEAAQAEALENERLAALGKLIAIVAHEIRNPLGTIRSSMYVIGRELQGRELGLEADLERARRNVLRCDAIIEELLDFTRDQGVVLRPTELDPFVGALLDEGLVPRGIEVVRRLASGVKVPLDGERFRRCLLNVIVNASQSMSARKDMRGKLIVETACTGERVEIRVTDTGVGIAGEDLERVFEPLFSTKTYGVGLGLSIVKRILDLHHGGVEIASEPGVGTSVTLWVPAAAGEVNS